MYKKNTRLYQKPQQKKGGARWNSGVYKVNDDNGKMLREKRWTEYLEEPMNVKTQGKTNSGHKRGCKKYM